MRHNIIFSGSNSISLDRDEHLIIDDMNKNLERFYFDLVKVVSVSQINTDTVEIKETASIDTPPERSPELY